MKISQKQIALHLLMKSNRENPTEYLPAWRFVGEFVIPELTVWVMASYKCPARLSDIYTENPEFLERTDIHGKSGSTYYGYRIKDPSKLQDQKLIAFCERIKMREFMRPIGDLVLFP